MNKAKKMKGKKKSGLKYYFVDGLNYINESRNWIFLIIGIFIFIYLLRFLRFRLYKFSIGYLLDSYQKLQLADCFPDLT